MKSMLGLGGLCIVMLIAFTLGDYHSEYNKWEEKYKLRTYCYNDKAVFNQSILHDSIRKSNDFPDYSQDEKDAVKIVYLYTFGDSDIHNIYKPLNKGLRDDNHDCIFFHEFKNLLNKAIRMLREKMDQPNSTVPLYRGMHVCNTFSGVDSYTFNQFISTSTNASTAFGFTNQNDCSEHIFMVFENAVHGGLLLKPYSMYPNKDEVLLMSGIRANIVINLNKTENADVDIESEISQIKDFPSTDVQVFIKLDNVEMPQTSSASTFGGNHPKHLTTEKISMYLSLILLCVCKY